LVPASFLRKKSIALLACPSANCVDAPALSPSHTPPRAKRKSRSARKPPTKPSDPPHAASTKSTPSSPQARHIIFTHRSPLNCTRKSAHAGEFGGLFGDGASAFLVRGASGDANSEPTGTTAIANEAKSASLAYRIRDFLFGCADQYADAVKVEGKLDGSLAVVFEGEALSRAAISRLEKVIAALEKLSAIPRAAVGAFATHQPNPRLLTLLSKVAGVSADAFPPIATTSGNLGSSTCGAALHAALQMFRSCSQPARKPIFLASLGPGLVFGGAWLSPFQN
jgi:3-oxoacyl-[acyl-carrier-protein] synthase III